MSEDSVRLLCRAAPAQKKNPSVVVTIRSTDVGSLLVLLRLDHSNATLAGRYPVVPISGSVTENFRTDLIKARRSGFQML